MNKLKAIGDIMARDLITVGPSETIEDILAVFNKNNIHHLPVMELNKLVGIVSKSDLIFFNRKSSQNKAIYKETIDTEKLKKFTARDIMTSGMAKVDEDEPIRTAISLFKLNKFHALPVMRKEKLVGIVTTFDIIRLIDEEKVGLKDYGVK